MDNENLEKQHKLIQSTNATQDFQTRCQELDQATQIEIEEVESAEKELSEQQKATVDFQQKRDQLITENTHLDSMCREKEKIITNMKKVIMENKENIR